MSYKDNCYCKYNIRESIGNNNLNTKLDWNLNFLHYLRLGRTVNTSNFWFKLHKIILQLVKIIDYQTKYMME